MLIIPNLWSPNLVHQHWPPRKRQSMVQRWKQPYSVGTTELHKGLVNKGETVVLTPEGSLFLGVTSGGSRICFPDSRKRLSPDSQQRSHPVLISCFSHIENMTKNNSKEKRQDKKEPSRIATPLKMSKHINLELQTVFINPKIYKLGSTNHSKHKNLRRTGLVTD